jgi:serine/threonine protein phosphatase 1
MSTFVISDIHGNNELFRRLLKQIRLQKADRLILLGDLIDRGVDSKGVLDTIILLKDNGFNLECLMGNHEQMLLDALLNVNNLNVWLLNGGDKTLISFLTKSIEKIPLKYIDLVASFKYYLEMGSFIFVHAALNMHIDEPFSDINTILWERNPYKYLNVNWINNRRLIHGHNPKSQEEILKAIENDDKIICIDNGIYLKKPDFGTLCVLELETFKAIFFK